jgi:hypothetical protein
MWQVARRGFPIRFMVTFLLECSRLESSLKFRGREEVVAGQDQGGDASELRLGLMSSVWRKGCIPAISGRCRVREKAGG